MVFSTVFSQCRRTTGTLHALETFTTLGDIGCPKPWDCNLTQWIVLVPLGNQYICLRTPISRLDQEGVEDHSLSETYESRTAEMDCSDLEVQIIKYGNLKVNMDVLCHCSRVTQKVILLSNLQSTIRWLNPVGRTNNIIAPRVTLGIQ